MEEFSQAFKWAKLREWYLETYSSDLRALLKPLLYDYKPSSISDPKDGGDSGWVYFTDNSDITWDWDNGDFVIRQWDGDKLASELQLSYPWYTDDPLFFDYSQKA